MCWVGDLARGSGRAWIEAARTQCGCAKVGVSSAVVVGIVVGVGWEFESMGVSGIGGGGLG